MSDENKKEPQEAAPNGESQPEDQSMKDKVIEMLHTVYDPEIPVDIYELGLVYDVAINDAGEAYIKMTLTSPACPVAGSLPTEVEMKTRSVEGITDVKVDLVWDPPWTPDMMTEAARLTLNM